MFDNISIWDLRNIQNPNLIDIRSIEKYNSSHINGAKNIPLNKILIDPVKYMNKNEKYYIYCQQGLQSRKLCQILGNMGYNVVNVIGGYENWIMNQ